MDGPFLTSPPPHADHAAWLLYAISQGMPEAQARGRTRDQLRSTFLPSGGPIGSVPDLERLDEDRAAIAARREARS